MSTHCIVLVLGCFITIYRVRCGELIFGLTRQGYSCSGAQHIFFSSSGLQYVNFSSSSGLQYVNMQYTDDVYKVRRRVAVSNPQLHATPETRAGYACSLDLRIVWHWNVTTYIKGAKKIGDKASKLANKVRFEHNWAVDGTIPMTSICYMCHSPIFFFDGKECTRCERIVRPVVHGSDAVAHRCSCCTRCTRSACSLPKNADHVIST
jgi:hypothetical protein